MEVTMKRIFPVLGALFLVAAAAAQNHSEAGGQPEAKTPKIIGVYYVRFDNNSNDRVLFQQGITLTLK
jgi:hypothetical protein